ncbi:MAG: hypothetical protein ACXWT0_01755 [Methylobacter sp.]
MKKLERFKRYGSSISGHEPRMIHDKQGPWCKFEEVKPLIDEFQKAEREFWTSVAKHIVDQSRQTAYIWRVSCAILSVACMCLLYLALK